MLFCAYFYVQFAVFVLSPNPLKKYAFPILLPKGMKPTEMYQHVAKYIYM